MIKFERIEYGSHRGEYLVEIEGVKKILPYADIIKLRKELEKKIEENKKIITEAKEEFFTNDVEPTVADVAEAPKKEEPVEEVVESVVEFEEKPKKKYRKSKK